MVIGRRADATPSAGRFQPSHDGAWGADLLPPGSRSAARVRFRRGAGPNRREPSTSGRSATKRRRFPTTRLWWRRYVNAAATFGQAPRVRAARRAVGVSRRQGSYRRKPRTGPAARDTGRSRVGGQGGRPSRQRQSRLLAFRVTVTVYRCDVLQRRATSPDPYRTRVDLPIAIRTATRFPR